MSENGNGNESMNKDLIELHDTLVSKVADLAKKVARAQDSNTANTLLREMEEFNLRVVQTGNLLFTAETKKITAAMERVRAAETDVDNAIKRIDSLTNFLKGVTAFLALVDKVIDTAKLVAV
jgi:hypothetical protein